MNEVNVTSPSEYSERVERLVMPLESGEYDNNRID